MVNNPTLTTLMPGPPRVPILAGCLHGTGLWPGRGKGDSAGHLRGGSPTFPTHSDLWDETIVRESTENATWE